MPEPQPGGTVPVPVAVPPASRSGTPGPDGGETAGLDEADRLAVGGQQVREGIGVAGDGPVAALQGRLRELAAEAAGGPGDMAAVHPAQMLNQIGQRPLGAGRHCTSWLGTKATAAGNATDCVSISRSRTGNATRMPTVPRTTAVDFHSGTGARQVRNTGRAPSDTAVPSSRDSSSAAPPTRTNRIRAIPPSGSAGYAPPATCARACARRGPLHGTREWIARVPVKRSDRGTHRLSRRSCA